MPSSSPRIVLHGGFHKTGTTHLQRLLKRNQGHLARRGVRYVHHRETRKELTVPVQLNAYFHAGVPRRRRIDDAALRQMTTQFFRKIGKRSPDRLLISDENLAGHCGQCVREGELYSFRREFVATFARELPHPVEEVRLSVRNHADFFAAAYVEFLRSLKKDSAPDRFVAEDRMKAQVLDRLPAWAEVIADIAAAFPDSRLVVWRYEDYSRLSDRILSNLCGDAVDTAKLKPPRADRPRPTASGRAVARLLQLERRKGSRALVEHRIKVQEAFPAGDRWPRYDPWTPEERCTLEAHYEKDWAAIEASGACTVLAPEPQLQG